MLYYPMMKRNADKKENAGDGATADDDLFDPVIARLKSLEAQVARLQRDCADAEETADYYKKAAEASKSRLGARAALEAVLPFVSEVMTEAEESGSEELFNSVALRYAELERDLKKAGVTLLRHKAGEAADPSYICNIRPVWTEEESRDGRIAKCTRIGCSFSDGSDPILECMDVFRFKDKGDKE